MRSTQLTTEERIEDCTWLDSETAGYTDLGYTGQRNYTYIGQM